MSSCKYLTKKEKRKKEENMKRRVIVILMSLLIIGTLTGCGTNTNTDKKALLVVSFGSSFIDNRAASIDATEAALVEAFPDYDKFTAFTSQIIIDIYRDRDQVEYYNVTEAMALIKKEGYGEVLVVPTHVINGEEYDQMCEAIEPFEDEFASIIMSKPLLTQVSDYERVAQAIASELPEVDEQTAVVLMGHGTHHHANSAYPSLDYVFKHNVNEHIYVGTVEGSPDFNNVAEDLENKGYEKVLLMPLMVVAGDHAHNDMAGDEEDSWKIMFKSLGYDVDILMKGMGELPAIQKLYVEHANEAIAEKDA